MTAATTRQRSIPAWRLFLLALLLLLATGCSEAENGGVYSGTLVFSGAQQFPAGTRLPGDLYIRAGTAQFAAGSQVAGSVYLLGGTLEMNGRVGGNLTMLDGRVVLGPNAVVQGDLRVGGGSVQRAATAVVAGEVVQGFEGLALPLDPAPRGADDVVRALVGALLLAALAYVLVRRRPEPVAHVAQAAVDHAPVSLALGALVAIVLPALLTVMAFTIVLIPLVALLAAIIVLLLGYGFIALGTRIGRALARLLPGSLSPAVGAAVGTFLLLAAFELPLLGSVLLLLAAVLVAGALLLTRLGLRPYVTPGRLRGPEDLSSYERPR